MANMKEDRLGTMVRLQKQFQEDILGHGDLTALLGTDKMAEYFRTQSLALVFELGEASNEIGWKPWATTRHLNHQAYRGELIDALHFLLNLMLLDGMTADDVYEGYLEKQAVNRDRQANGYTGTHKCPACARAYDDPDVLCRPAEAGWYSDGRVNSDRVADGRGGMVSGTPDPEARGPWCQQMYPRPLQVKDGECPNCRARYGEPATTCHPPNEAEPGGWCNTSKQRLPLVQPEVQA